MTYQSGPQQAVSAAIRLGTGRSSYWWLYQTDVVRHPGVANIFPNGQPPVSVGVGRGAGVAGQRPHVDVVSGSCVTFRHEFDHVTRRRSEVLGVRS